MWRRGLTAALAFGIVVAPLVAGTQQTRVFRIGVLSYLSRGDPPGTLALLEGLRDLGYVEGKSMVVDWQGAQGDATKFRRLADDLVRGKVDIIVATGDTAIEAARAATRTIPIVMVTPSDPIGSGFIRTLAHPEATSPG